MTTLAGLSSGTLGPILSDPALKIAPLNLWKCGNKALNNRIRQCTNLVVRLESFNRTPLWRFPKVLFSLTLAKVTIFSPGFEFESPRGMSEALQHLPKSLKWLEISVPSPYACLVDYAAFPASVTRPPTALRKDRTTSHIWNIGNVLPSLETLRLGVEDVPNEYWLTNSDLKLLPTSLASFRFQFRKNRKEVSDIATESLPRGLRKLELFKTDFDKLLQIKNLPPQLEFLGHNCFGVNFAIEHGAEILSLLPKSLTEIVAHCFIPEHFKPGSVPNLQVARFGELEIPKEPFFKVVPHLTLFELFPDDDRDPALSFTSESLYWLPQSITQLRIPACNGFQLKAWPSSLTHLAIHNAGILDKAACLELPPVKKLSIQGSGMLPFQMVLIMHLPRTVTDLKIEEATSELQPPGALQNGATAEDTIINHHDLRKQHYPPHLTSLLTSLHSMPLACLSQLPDTLLSLDVDLDATLTAETATQLPPNLTSLSSASATVTAAALSRLPSSLTNLYFCTLDFTDASGPVEPQPRGCAVQLPPSLKYLELAEIHSGFIPDGSYLALPDSLERMSAGYAYLAMSMDLKLIRTLPPKLRSFGFHIPPIVYPDPEEPISPTFEELILNHWLPMLPQSITSLSLSYPDSVSDIGGNVLDLLHPNIIKLELFTGYNPKRCDLLRDFTHRRLLLSTPDPRLHNNIYGTHLEPVYYELPGNAAVESASYD